MLAGEFLDQWMVDPIQAGAGTSHNMNTNEVLANLANEALGGRRGEYKPIHPNDHVNMAQSTNDVFPTAMRIASLTQLQELYPVLDRLQSALADKGREFDKIIKSGRTHMQDAVPIRLGQEFTAYSVTTGKLRKKIEQAAESLLELNIGATAAGTGLNSDPRYQKAVVRKLESMRLGKAAALVREGIGETLGYMAFPREHWRSLPSPIPSFRLPPGKHLGSNETPYHERKKPSVPRTPPCRKADPTMNREIPQNWLPVLIDARPARQAYRTG